MLTIDIIDIELTLFQVSVLFYDNGDAIEVNQLESSRNTTGVGAGLASLASETRW